MEALLVMLPIVKRDCGGRLPMGQGHSHPAGWNCRYEPLHPLPRPLGLRVGSFHCHGNHNSGRAENIMTKCLFLSRIFRYLQSCILALLQGILKIIPFAYINTCKLNAFENALRHWCQMAWSKPPCTLGILPAESGWRQTAYWECPWSITAARASSGGSCSWNKPSFCNICSFSVLIY